jgi:transcriptional regulator with XRE-family HTH domain
VFCRFLQFCGGDFVFYDIFAELCEEMNVTPAMVRKDLGISQSTMASWKSRGLSPSAGTLIQISEYFGTTPAYLLGNRLARYPDCAPSKHKSITVNVTPDAEFAELQKKLDNDTITQEELRRYKDILIQGIDNAHKYISGYKKQLGSLMDMLTEEGQEKAVERVQELTEIPRYQRLQSSHENNE